MTRADRDKWDAKHGAQISPTADPPAPPVLLASWRTLLPRRGRALDLACGPGGAALWLAANTDLRVDALDVSGVALHRLLAAGRAPDRNGMTDRVPSGRPVQPIQADLDAPPLRPGCHCYDLIVVVSFLDRRLFRSVPEWLAPRGILYYETFHTGHRESAPDFRPEWTLARGELATAFPSLETVMFVEDATRSALLARSRD